MCPLGILSLSSLEELFAAELLGARRVADHQGCGRTAMML